MEQQTVTTRPWRTGQVFWTVTILALLAGTLFWTWFTAGSDSFAVEGMPFRTWVARHPDFEIRDPLARLGTNAVPHLLTILRRGPDSARAFQLKESLWKVLPVSLQRRYAYLRPIPDWQVRRTALFGVRFLKTDARAALPHVLRIARTETNLMVRASALTAALNIAPLSPETFELWRREWEQTNHFSRHDLAVYLQEPRVPIPAAVPYLLQELTNRSSLALQPVLETFGFFGEAARPAMPQMLRLLSYGWASRLELLPIFERLGPIAADAVPALTACLEEQGPVTVSGFSSVTQTQVQLDARPDLVAGALRALQAIGPQGQPALPAIDRFLTNSDPTLRMLAAAAHVRVGAPPQLALPLLVAGLKGELRGPSKAYLRIKLQEENSATVTKGPEAAAILCGELGEVAAEALPVLEQRLQDRNPWIRLSAAQAIWRISHNPAKSLPTLVALLDSVAAPGPGKSSTDDQQVIRSLEAIAEMGPVAKAALPSIERVRPFSMATYHAANRALADVQKTN